MIVGMEMGKTDILDGTPCEQVVAVVKGRRKPARVNDYLGKGPVYKLHVLRNPTSQA